MIHRVLAAGLLAGLAAGLAIAVLQQVTTTPLILAAEAYETAAAAPPAVPLASAGLARALQTGVATVGLAVGFAWLLLAGMLASGEAIEERRLLAWAAAAFVATGLAPAAGLPPELPGSAKADLADSQAWRAAASLATAAALWLFLVAGGAKARLAAVALALAPHVIGAPHPQALADRAPAELAARFAALSLALHAALWLATGYALGVLWPRLGRR